MVCLYQSGYTRFAQDILDCQVVLAVLPPGCCNSLTSTLNTLVTPSIIHTDAIVQLSQIYHSDKVQETRGPYHFHIQICSIRLGYI